MCVFFHLTGDEHDIVRVLSPGHVDGHPTLRPQGYAPSVPLHVSWRRDHGHDVPEAIRECMCLGVPVYCRVYHTPPCMPHPNRIPPGW